MSRLVNRYDGVCSLKKHRPLDGAGNPIPFYEYKQLEDAVKVPAGEGSVFKAGRGWLIICAECKTQQDERRAAKRTAKAQAKVTAAAETVQANEQAQATVFAAPEETAIAVVPDILDSVPPGREIVQQAEGIFVAEAVVPDKVILSKTARKKHKPFSQGVEGLNSLFG